MDVDGPFMFTKWWKFTTKKPLVTSLIFILNFQKNWIRFMMISKIELKRFQINLMLELFMCLRLKLLELLFKNYSLGVTCFFSNSWSQLFAKCFVFYIFLEFALFFPFFLEQIRNQKNMLVEGSGGGGGG